MMRKKRLICILSILTLLLCSCASKNNSDKTIMKNNITTDKSLYEHGLDIISLMDELVRSDSYAEAMGNASQIQDVVNLIREGDYTNPDTIYKINISDETFHAILVSSFINPEDLSETLGAYLNKKMLNNIINLANSKFGTVNLATSSIFTTEKTFVSNEISSDTMYIYTYEHGFPIAIIFSPGESGAITAKGTFLLDEDFDIRTAEDMEKYLKNTICLTDFQVEQINEN